MLPVYLYTSVITSVVAVNSVIQGSGASFQAVVQSGWIAAYNSLSFSYLPNVKVEYKSSGSGSGLNDALAGRSLWGSSDALPSVLSPANANKFTVLPIFGGAIAVVYNLPEITGKTLVLSREAIVKIFNGTILYWNDAELAALNANITLPNKKISLVVRKDSSGSTTALTQFFSSVSPEWQSKTGASGLPNWQSVGVNTTAHQSILGVSKAVIANSYTISYMDLYDAVEQVITYADVINKNGNQVTPDATSTQIALSGNQNDFTSLSHVDSPLAGAYPITTFTYVLLNKLASQFNDESSFRAAMRYIYWTFTDSYAQRLISRKNYVRLPESALQYSLGLMKDFQYKNGTALFGQAVCDKDNLCQNNGVCSIPTSPFVPASIGCICNNKLFANSQKLDCSEAAVSQVVKQSDPEAGFFIFLAAAGLVMNVFVAQMLIGRASHPSIKAISPSLCLFIILGCTFSYTAVFLFIGEPSAVTCNLRPFWLSLAFGLTFGMMTAKNYRIFKIFGNASRRVDDSLTDRNLVLRFGAGICLVELILSSIWIAASSLQPAVVLNSSVYVVKTCQSSNSDVSSAVAVLLYLFNVGLLLASMYFAYQTRYAGEKFNESRATTVAIYTIVLVLIVALPLIYSGILDYQSIFVLTSLTLIVCPMFIISIIFGSKLYELYIARYFKKELAYDMGNSMFSRTATTGGNKTFGDVSQTGLSFWNFNIKKKRIGATVQQSVLVVIPELNWLCVVEDMTSSQLKTFESVKLSECVLVDGETPESCFIKAPGGGFGLENQSKDMMSRFKKYFARVVQSAIEINKANAAQKVEKSVTVSTVEDV